MSNININNIKPNTKFIAKNIVYFESVDSTNNIAKESDNPHGTLFVAETQTGGKGRMGRTWLSEKNCGIFTSLLLMPCIPAESINKLTLIAGLSVCEALTELYKMPFGIKWPNDIVINGKKICGILTEGIVSQHSVKTIIGIGINVNNESFPADLTEKATSIYMLTGKKTQREAIINKFAEIFEKYYIEFTKGIDLTKKYEKLCVNINNEVTAIKDGKKIKGTAVGITENGELIIKKEDGTSLNIHSGEVSVRGIYGYC